jgi:hypothetical protein
LTTVALGKRIVSIEQEVDCMAKGGAAVAEEKDGLEGRDRNGALTKQRFAQELAAVVQEELGIEIGIEASWELFEAVFKKTVDLALEKPVSLAGIGIFDVQKTRPRGSKVGVVAFVPRFRLRTSTAVDEYLEWKLGVMIPSKEKPAKVEKSRVDGSAWWHE